MKKNKSRTPAKTLTQSSFTAKVSRNALLTSAILATMPMLATNAWAVSACGAGGTTTISTAETDRCIPTSNEIVAVTSSGEIQVSSGVALSVASTSTNVSLENHGTIASQSNTAIRNDGAIFVLTNTGFIQAGTLGSSIDNMGTITSIINSGTMRSTYGVYNRASIGTIINSGTIETVSNNAAIYINNGGTIAEIINSGVIRGGGSLAIENNNIITNGITNTGLIDGQVMIGGATLYLNGTQGRVTGAVSGSVGSAVVVNGTFSTESNFNVNNFTIANSGILNFTAGTSITASVENSGIVNISDGTTANIDGNYTQLATGTLEVDASSASSHGVLNVLGRGTFAASTNIVVDVASNNTLANNNVLHSVVTATGGVTASTFNLNDNSQLFNFEAIVNANSIDLRTLAASSTGVLTSVRNEGFGQGVGAARVLDSFIGGSTAGDVTTVVDALGILDSEQAVSNAVAQTLPLMSASLDQVTTNSMRSTNRVIQARQEGNVGRSSGEGFLGNKHFWFKPVAAKANQGSRNGVAGYNADTYGFIIGADAEVSEISRVGLAFSYMNSDVDGKSTARYNGADIDAYQVIAYGSHNLASDANFEFNWQADVGINKNDGSRSINFGGLNRVAKSDFDSTTAHLGAGVGRSFQLSEKTSFIPTVRADYFWIRNDSYTEKGADALNLKVGSANSKQLIAMVEGRLQHRLTDRAALTANVGIGYDVLDEKNSIAASYVGGGSAFRTEGLELSPWIGRAGLGLSVNATESTEITARYDIEDRSDFVGQTASLKVRWAF